MPDKGPGVDIDGGHRLGLVDDQIAPGFELDFTLQRALNFVLNVKEIEYRLTAAVVFQLAGHFRDIFGGEFEQRLIGQARVDANAIQLRIGKITQHALGQSQLAIQLIAGLVALFALHHLGPYALKISGIGGHLLLVNAFRSGANDKPALLIAIFCDDLF